MSFMSFLLNAKISITTQKNKKSSYKNVISVIFIK